MNLFFETNDMQFFCASLQSFIAHKNSTFIDIMASNISCNDNQNYLVKQGRTTSRVLAPPGGFTSLSFGCEAPAPKTKEGTKQQGLKAFINHAFLICVSKEAVVAPSAAVPATTETVAAPVVKDESSSVPASNIPGPKETPVPPKEVPISSNAFASGSNMNGAQVMTGRPTSRVLAPPGGHTTIKLW
jgi:SPIRAL1-like protein